MTFREVIPSAIMCVAVWAGITISQHRSKGKKINWPKMALEAALLATGFFALTFPGWGMGAKRLTTALIGISAIALFFVAWFLARKHTIKSYARSIVNFTAGGMNAPFKGKPHKIPNAVALCEKWRIQVPPFEFLPQPTADGKNACHVCGEHVVGKQFHPFIGSPLSYRRLMRYRLFDSRPLTRKERKGRVINMWDWSSGMQYLLGFCSQECQASFVLWNFYIPITRWQRLRWPFIVAAWYLNRLFRRVFP